ncbi:MAG TPA: TetR family transcriptional regulator [Solirubrobacteraceae bacterium]|jgi:AcrR family transcriptional regulator|nr:TetR family transcriptional regulator [Solirubrobacteraceae bacterium]
MTQGSLGDIQRTRILDAMVAVIYERGFAGASVGAVCARAKISSRTFYEAFDGREQCFLAVLDEGYRQIGTLVADAFERAERWQDGMLDALAGLLSLLDAEPRRARVWLVESLCAGVWALECRERHLKALARTIAVHCPVPAEPPAPRLASAGMVTSVAGIVQAHLITAEPQPLITLLGPLMGLVTSQYLDARAVHGEIDRAERLGQTILARREAGPPSRVASEPPVEIPAALRDPRAHRVRRCLLYLAQHPGASNRQIADAIGIARHDQASTLLARLAAMGLIDKHPGARGHPNAWTLTQYGARVSPALASMVDAELEDRIAQTQPVPVHSGRPSA